MAKNKNAKKPKKDRMPEITLGASGNQMEASSTNTGDMAGRKNR